MKNISDSDLESSFFYDEKQKIIEVSKEGIVLLDDGTCFFTVKINGLKDYSHSDSDNKYDDIFLVKQTLDGEENSTNSIILSYSYKKEPLVSLNSKDYFIKSQIDYIKYSNNINFYVTYIFGLTNESKREIFNKKEKFNNINYKTKINNILKFSEKKESLITKVKNKQSVIINNILNNNLLAEVLNEDHLIKINNELFNTNNSETKNFKNEIKNNIVNISKVYPISDRKLGLFSSLERNLIKYPITVEWNKIDSFAYNNNSLIKRYELHSFDSDDFSKYNPYQSFISGLIKNMNHFIENDTTILLKISITNKNHYKKLSSFAKNLVSSDSLKNELDIYIGEENRLLAEDYLMITSNLIVIKNNPNILNKIPANIKRNDFVYKVVNPELKKMDLLANNISEIIKCKINLFVINDNFRSVLSLGIGMGDIFIKTKHNFAMPYELIKNNLMFFDFPNYPKEDSFIYYRDDLGRINKFNLFSLNQTINNSGIIIGTSGSGKSNIFNNLVLDFILKNNYLKSETKYKCVLIDVGKSSELLVESLKHFKLKADFINLSDKGINILETPIGIKLPTATQKSFLKSFFAIASGINDEDKKEATEFNSLIDRVLEKLYNYPKSMSDIDIKLQDEYYDYYTKENGEISKEKFLKFEGLNLANELFSGTYQYQAKRLHSLVSPTLFDFITLLNSTSDISNSDGANSRDSDFINHLCIGLNGIKNNFKFMFEIDHNFSDSLWNNTLTVFEIKDILEGIQNDNTKKELLYQYLLFASFWVKNVSISDVKGEGSGSTKINKIFENYYKKIGSDLKLLVAIDEIKNINDKMHSTWRAINKKLDEGRKEGVALLLATQDIKTISTETLNKINNTIILYYEPDLDKYYDYNCFNSLNNKIIVSDIKSISLKPNDKSGNEALIIRKGYGEEEGGLFINKVHFIQSPTLTWILTTDTYDKNIFNYLTQNLNYDYLEAIELLAKTAIRKDGVRIEGRQLISVYNTTKNTVNALISQYEDINRKKMGVYEIIKLMRNGNIKEAEKKLNNIPILFSKNN